jgi:hypothetical protein
MESSLGDRISVAKSAFVGRRPMTAPAAKATLKLANACWFLQVIALGHKKKSPTADSAVGLMGSNVATN